MPMSIVPSFVTFLNKLLYFLTFSFYFSLQYPFFFINYIMKSIIVYKGVWAMGKKATKAADNMYYLARYEASKGNDDFNSREKSAEIIGIDRTRLARIELDAITPYPEEVLAMSRTYNSPELCNSYCARECPIGRTSVKEVTIDDFDRLALKVLGSLKDIDSLRMSLIAISEDGVISESERPAFQHILDSLEKISTNAKALQLWAIKNIHIDG